MVVDFKAVCFCFLAFVLQLPMRTIVKLKIISVCHEQMMPCETPF